MSESTRVRQSAFVLLLRAIPVVIAVLAVIGAATRTPVMAGLTVSIPFFSQNGNPWKCDPLGSCSGTTIGTCGKSNSPSGCAMTCVTMLLKYRGANVDPGKLNKYLRSNGGYDGGCLINWSKAADFDGKGGLTWVGTGSLSSPKALKDLLDQGRLVIARSSRFSQHWGVVRGYRGSGKGWPDFTYLDPWDTAATERTLGDGWIGSGAATRIYR